MHYYKRNLGDYAKKAGRLSMLQHGSYTLLIDSCYDREQFPTLEQALEWTWASTTEEKEAVTFVLHKFFTLEDGVFVQKRIQEELLAYHDKSEKNTRIAMDRETKRNETRTKRAPDVNASPPQEHEAPPNQEPRTKNHNKEDPKGSCPASRTPSQILLEKFHEKCTYLPRVSVFNEDRRRTLQARFKEVMAGEKWDSEQTLRWFEDFYGIVNQSKFLSGRAPARHDGRVFKADWDWIHGPKNFVKIVEGKYSGD